jgi:hypothetical protein
MPPPRNPSEGNGFSDSDQQWFDRLSGKLGAVTDPQAVREANALRRALELDAEAMAADPEIAADTTDAEEQRRWEQLQFRLKREGLLAEPAGRWWRRWPAATGLAAAALLSALLIPLWQGTNAPDYDEPPIMKGEIDTRNVRATEPRRAAETLVKSLQQAGLKAALYQRDKTYVIDMVLAPEELAAAEPALRALGLQPRAGFARIEIDAP